MIRRVGLNGEFIRRGQRVFVATAVDGEVDQAEHWIARSRAAEAEAKGVYHTCHIVARLLRLPAVARAFLYLEA